MIKENIINVHSLDKLNDKRGMHLRLNILNTNSSVVNVKTSFACTKNSLAINLERNYVYLIDIKDMSR